MSDVTAYPGSCHCGRVQYQVKLKFPPILDDLDRTDTISIYKCNCSTCQKMGYFHLRPINPTEHYILLSPKPEELGDYRCFEKKHGWYFCKHCGVRIVGLGGSWEPMEIHVDEWAGTKEGQDTRTQTVYKTVAPPGKKMYYLSVNATSLEPSEDVDLIKWHENGWIFYVECRTREYGEPPRFGRPYAGGMY
ncbi:hypothetical protein ACEQ8H_005961 [Pleosporales sp. CAS-2024a]